MAVFFLSRIVHPTVVYLAMNPVLTVLRGFWWQPFTYMFVHHSPSHLFFNMLGLYLFGRAVEQALGSWEFILFYLVTGVLAGVFSLIVYLATGAYNVSLLGASGAVFAVLLAFATFYPNTRVFIMGIIPMRAATMVLLYTALELYSQLSGSRGNVAHLTHLAGFGFAYLYFLLRHRINPFHEFFR